MFMISESRISAFHSCAEENGMHIFNVMEPTFASN